MANAYFLNQYITTNLNVGGGIDASQTTGIALLDVTGIDIAKPGVALLSYSEPLNTANAEWVTYTSINGSNELVGVTRGAEGFAAKAHGNQVSIAFPLSASHVNSLATALSIDGVATNAVTKTINTEAESSDANTELVTKTYVDASGSSSSQDGWFDNGLTGVTVTRQSIDNPTVVLRFDADVTDYIWKGMRIKATENAIVHYFIVSADPVFSSPNTDVTCLSEIDTATPTQAKALIGETAISAVEYAPPKTFPKGFPIAKQSWRIVYTHSTDVTVSTGSTESWVNSGIVFICPTGDFQIFIDMPFSVAVGSSRSNIQCAAALSTTVDSATHPHLTSHNGMGVNTAATTWITYSSWLNRDFVSLASKTTFNVLARRQQIDSIARFRGSSDRVGLISATSTLL